MLVAAALCHAASYSTANALATAVVWLVSLAFRFAAKADFWPGCAEFGK